MLYTIVPYGVRKDDERIDYDELDRLADEHKPKMIIVGASAYPRVIDFARIRAAANRDRRGGLHRHGAHRRPRRRRRAIPSPVPHSDFVTTTTHKTLRGPRGGMVLCREQYAKDLDRSVFPGVQGGPLMHIIAAKAVCFKEAGGAGVHGLPAADRRQRRPAGAARSSAAGFRLVSGGTDNHLMLVDVFSKGITGKVAEAALGKAGITVNKNAIPFDQNPPMVASGIRVGTPAVTTRGMREAGDGYHRRAHRPRAARRPTTMRALGDDPDGSRTAVPEVPAVPGHAGLKRADAAAAEVSTATPSGRAAFAPTAPLARAAARTSSRAPARSRWPPPSRARSRRAACCSPKPAPAPARRSPISFPRS